eukprot:3582960-Amphidinium_carterae.1
MPLVASAPPSVSTQRTCVLVHAGPDRNTQMYLWTILDEESEMQYLASALASASRQFCHLD